MGWIRELMERCGSLDYARNIAYGLAGGAQREFEIAFGHLPDSRDKRFIGELPRWIFVKDQRGPETNGSLA